MAEYTKNIIYGAPVSRENYSDGANSLAEFYLNRLTAQKELVSLIDGISYAELTSDALLVAAIRVANGLRALGVTDADRVAVCAENRLDLAAAIFGIILTGSTLVAISPAYMAQEMHHAVQLTRPKIVFVSAECFAVVSKEVERSAFVQNLISFDAIPGTISPKTIVFDDLIGDTTKQNVAPQFYCKPQNMAEKVALILFSSGTTGLPKGVQITEKNILVGISNQEHEVDEYEHRLAPVPIVLSIGPWSHAFGCLVMLGLLPLRSQIVFLSKFVDKDYLNAIQKYRVNKTYVVPPLMVFLAKHPIVAQYDLSSLKVIRCGAAPLSQELADAVRARIDVPIVRQGYGMTETTLAIIEQSTGHQKSGSVGVLKPGSVGRVVDIETGHVLGANQRGELQFSGPMIMKGYVGDEAATRATVDAEGWLHTGDIGYYDEDGEWFIVDRLKELIKYNGFQVPPAELEGILLQHPLISDAGVVGVADERFGELPLAFVVRQADSLTEQAVIDFVAERCSKAKRLHGGVRFVAAIPKNPSGKILRRELRQLLVSVQSKL